MLKMLVVSLAFLSVSAFPGLQGAGGGLAKAADVPAVQTELSGKSDKEESSVLSAQLAEREAELAAREAQLAAREAEVVKQDKASSAASVELAEREAELAKQEAAFAEREAELARQGKATVASSAELAAREAQLAEREAALTARETALVNQDKVSVASSAELAAREAELAKREAALSQREADLATQDKASVASSAELAAREAELAKREAALSQREADLATQDKASVASSAELSARAADLEAREAALKKEEALLAERRKADLEAREAELKKKEAALTEKESALQVKEIALMDKAPVVAQAPVAVPDVNGPGAVIVKKENGLMNWTENYIEATGMAVAPTGMKGAQGKALARRGATLDLQRNLLEFLKGVQVDARTTMNDFMAEDRVRSELSGVIKNVEIMNGEWDGEAYTITGRIKLPPVRAVVAPRILVETYKEPKPKKSSGRYTGLVIDARHLPLVPSMSFRVLDESGKAVYGMSFADYDRYLQSGLCAYYNNINYAKGEVHVASNPIVTKALKLRNGNVDIVISNAVAAQVRGSSYDFRKDCKVIIVSQ